MVKFDLIDFDFRQNQLALPYRKLPLFKKRTPLMMKRLDFIQKTTLLTSAAGIGGISIFKAATQSKSTKKFKFMEQKHPNLDVIHAFFTAYGSNDIQGIKKVLDERIKWHIPGEHPLSGTKTGIDEVLEYFKQLEKGSFKAEPIIMGVNDTHVIDCHRNWSNLENEENLDNMSCLLWSIEDHKIKEVHNFPENQSIVDLFFKKLYG